MRHEEENVDQKCEKTDEQGGNGEDEQSEEVSGRVRRSVKVGGDGEAKANEGQESGDWMNDEDVGE